jgi:hypothetical protein
VRIVRQNDLAESLLRVFASLFFAACASCAALAFAVAGGLDVGVDETWEVRLVTLPGLFGGIGLVVPLWLWRRKPVVADRILAGCWYTCFSIAAYYWIILVVGRHADETGHGGVWSSVGARQVWLVTAICLSTALVVLSALRIRRWRSR